jgi:hypothetical protein
LLVFFPDHDKFFFTAFFRPLQNFSTQQSRHQLEHEGSVNPTEARGVRGVGDMKRGLRTQGWVGEINTPLHGEKKKPNQHTPPPKHQKPKNKSLRTQGWVGEINTPLHGEKKKPKSTHPSTKTSKTQEQKSLKISYFLGSCRTVLWLLFSCGVL